MPNTNLRPIMKHDIEVRRTLTAAELIELDICGITEFDSCYIDNKTGELIAKVSTSIYIAEE